MKNFLLILGFAFTLALCTNSTNQVDTTKLLVIPTKMQPAKSQSSKAKTPIPKKTKMQRKEIKIIMKKIPIWVDSSLVANSVKHIVKYINQGNHAKQLTVQFKFLVSGKFWFFSIYKKKKLLRQLFFDFREHQRFAVDINNLAFTQKSMFQLFSKNSSRTYSRNTTTREPRSAG